MTSNQHAGSLIQKNPGGNSLEASKPGSSASSVKSGSSSSLASFDYLKAIILNVFAHGGYKHVLKYLKRSGQSKLSLQKVVKQLQKKFSPEEWYFYRKIHKKEKNYFLNQGGQKGDRGGGGWVTFDAKISKSTHSKISKNSSGVSSVEESKGGVLPNSSKHS